MLPQLPSITTTYYLVLHCMCHFQFRHALWKYSVPTNYSLHEPLTHSPLDPLQPCLLCLLYLRLPGNLEHPLSHPDYGRSTTYKASKSLARFLCLIVFCRCLQSFFFVSVLLHCGCTICNNIILSPTPPTTHRPVALEPPRGASPQGKYGTQMRET